MIFVILGTQDKPFKRLLECLEQADIQDKIIVQAGFTKFESQKMQIFDYVSMDEFNDYIAQADIVITHGGVGTIMNALNKGKKIIACARLSKYGEHQNDHQLQLIKPFKDAGYLLELGENDDITAKIQEAKHFSPKFYQSNNDKFVAIIKDYINKN